MEIKLIDCIPSLSSVCKIYSGKVAGFVLSKSNIIELNRFYRYFPSVQEIESGIMELIRNYSKEQRDLILNSLYKECWAISDIYRNNKVILMIWR